MWRGCGQAGSVQDETAQGGEDKGQEDRGADTTLLQTRLLSNWFILTVPAGSCISIFF